MLASLRGMSKREARVRLEQADARAARKSRKG
jgi:hypothetical protein